MLASSSVRADVRDLSMHRGLAVVIAVIVLGLAAPNAAPAREPACLTAGFATSDAAAIRALRLIIDADCACAAYDGTKGHTHRDYVKCARTYITPAVPTALRARCKRTAISQYARSTCGRAADALKGACIKTGKTGLVSCSIKSVAKCATNACAASFTHCIDAADTNGDLLINGGDSGACGCGPGQTDPQTDPSNCGSCGHACNAPVGGSVACAHGTCLPACASNQTLCGASADGGGQCFDGQCFVEVCPATTTSAGGIIGYSGTEDGTHITQIQAHCGIASYSTGLDPATRAVILTPADPLAAHGAGGGATWSVMCPANHVVVSFDSQDDGVDLRQLTLNCAPVLVDTAYNVSLGPEISIGPVGPSGTPVPRSVCEGAAPGGVCIGQMGSIVGSDSHVGDVRLVSGDLPSKSSGGCEVDRHRRPSSGIPSVLLVGLLLARRYFMRRRAAPAGVTSL